MGRHTGYTHSIETRQKMSANNARTNLGKTFSIETRLKMSVIASMNKLGENNPNWKGGTTAEAQNIRGSARYRNWRTAVFLRDNYTCQDCGARGCELNADHIKPFSQFPELRFEVSNGRTLCVPCHKDTPTYGFRCVQNRKKLLKTI